MHNRYKCITVYRGSRQLNGFGLALGTGLVWWGGDNRADGSLCFSNCWPLNSFYQALIPGDFRAKYTEVVCLGYKMSTPYNHLVLFNSFF